MPRLRARTAAIRVPELTKLRRFELISGREICGYTDAAERVRAELWRLHGAEITAQYAEFYRGQRPLYWWRYEPGIPEHLRYGQAEQRGDFGPGWGQLQDDRQAWLAQSGRLLPGEAEAIVEAARR
jgi:hypothetical protein